MNGKKRNIAFKVWIGDLVKGSYTRGEDEWDTGYIFINGKNVSRVNLIGTIVSVYKSEDYVSYVLDDGSGNIKLKLWEAGVKEFKVGDLVLVIGRIRNLNNETFVLPEIIRLVENINWLVLRKLELVSEYGERLKVTETAYSGVDTKEIVRNKRQEVLGMVENLDDGGGVDFMSIVSKSGLSEEVIVEIVNNLIKDGELYEPQPGKLRIMI